MAGKELQIIIKAIDKASSVFDGVEKKATGLGGALGTLGKVGGVALAGVATAGAAVGTALVGAGAAMGKLAVDAAPLAGIQAAFEGITENSDAMLASLREGSLGMVTDIDLMKNYNQAAMLVGDTFAEQLPDAMTYLTKVSAATGTSMDYLMNSLVTGVGRLSPMILDNLAIQVSLAEATERASQMYGVAADELTKEQQQAGMMDVIMEKLAATTAEMPEVAGTAAASWAALGVTFKNLKDRVGLALVPALETLLNALVPLVQEYGPRLVTLFAEKVVPVVEDVAEALALMLGGDIEAGLEKLFGTERTQQILAAAAAISIFAANLASALMGNEQGRTWATDMLAGLIEGIAAWFESGVLEDQAGELGEKLGAFLVDTLSATITSKDSENKIANALAQLLRAAPAAIWGAAGEMGLGIGEEAGAALREKLGKEPLSEEERERRTEMARNVNTFRDIKDWWTGPFAETPFAQWADSLATKIETLVGVRSPQLSADTLGDGRAGTETNTYNISFEPGAVVIEEKDITDANAVEYSMELGILKALSAAGVR